MKENKERPMLETAEAFIKKTKEILKDNNHEDVTGLRDDVERGMITMREAIIGAYNEEQRMMVLPYLTRARTKSEDLKFYMDLFAETGAISKGDSIELQSMFDELKEETTRIVKQINPKFDKWKEEYYEEFGQRPEDIDKID